MGEAKTTKDGLYLLILGSTLFLGLGFLLCAASRSPLPDFTTAYFSAKCLVRHCDPYNQQDVLNLYSEHFDISRLSPRDRLVAAGNVYPPSEFGFTIFFALLPLRLAQLAWSFLIAGSFVLACFLIWDLAACHAALIASIFVFYVLLTAQSLLYFGNPGAVAVPLCLIAVWCFLRERFVPMGIACLAISLALKPQDAGLIWLFFLLSGDARRKRALQAAALVLVVSLSVFFWVRHLSPNWISEMRSTQQQFFVHGGINDPSGDHGTAAITSLQAITSFFWQSPRAYNLASYLLCTPLLAVWIFATVRSRPSQTKTLFALASIAVLSLLPVYHRQYDAKIILLTIPAFALLWSRGGLVKKLALLVTSIGFLLNGELLWAVLLAWLTRIHMLNPGAGLARTTIAALNVPIPISLFVMGVFYLWIYARHALDESSHKQPGQVLSTPHRALAS